VVSVGVKVPKAVGVDSRAGLGEHQRLALPQQPRVAGPDDLPRNQQRQPAAQLVAVMASGRDAPSQRQISPVEPGGVRAAGQPTVLPGLSRLTLEPVHELGQASPPGLVASAARAPIGEQAEQPLDQRFSALAGLPPARLGWPRFPFDVLFHIGGAGLGDYGARRGDRHWVTPSGAGPPSNVASTSGR
jgi:hypothetical protein